MCKGSGGAAIIALHLTKAHTTKPLIINGHAWYIQKEVRKSWHFLKTTNNKMELEAFIAGLYYFMEHGTNSVYGASACTFVTDSKYVQLGATNVYKWREANWRNTSGIVKNQEEWKRYLHIAKLLSNLGKTFDVKWVKGHSGDYWNDRVDYLATEAAKSIQSKGQ